MDASEEDDVEYKKFRHERNIVTYKRLTDQMPLGISIARTW